MGDIVAIHQPNFMPWLGYFYKIYKANTFIFLDDVQIQKKGASYTNRVSILTGGESKYLTIPIKRSSGFSRINETEFVNSKWQKKMISTLQGSYSRACFFKENKNFVFELINFKVDNLAEYNINFIMEIVKKLNFDTTLSRSSQFKINSVSTKRLVELINAVDGSIYLSGSGGDTYQDHDLYKNEEIKLIYNHMPDFKYEQIKSDLFTPSLSIIDAIFNIGFEMLINKFFVYK